MSGLVRKASRVSEDFTSGRSRAGVWFSYHLVYVLLSFWPVSGLYIDGWAHHQRWSESFFTPWHTVLYSGVLAVIIVLIGGLILRRNISAHDRQAYGLSLLGVVLFALSGGVDLFWHSVYGIEVEVESLISPPHLGLFIGGALAVSAPLRMSEAELGVAKRGVQLIRLGSLTLLALLAVFVAQFLHPLVVALGRSEFAATGTDLSRYSLQSLAAAEAIVTTVILAAVVTAAYGWYRLPLGSAGLVILVTSISAAALRENWELMVVGPTSAVVAEALHQQVGHRRASNELVRALASAISVVFYLTYVMWLNATEDVWWDFQFWSGLAILVALVGWLVSYLMTHRHPGLVV